MEITGNDLLKKRRERINDNQTKEKISGKDLLQMHKKYQTYRAMDTSEVNDAYIDTFYKDWNSFSSSAEKDYEGLGWSNASSSYDSRNSAWNELSKRADTIEAYYYKNRNNVKNEDGYASMINDLNEIRSSASKILKSFQTEADYYSNWATEDEYNEWNKYSYITGLDNFAEKSKYVSTYRGGEKYNAFTNTYTDTGYDDIMYDYINRDENARATKAVNDISSNASFLGFDKSERREMTDDEISIFNYIYATQGKDAAYEYVDHITAGPVGLNARQRAKETEEWASYAKESPVASSVFSVFEAPLKGLSYIGQAADYLDDGKIDQNTGYNKFSYVNSAIRNQVTQDVEKNWGGVGSFAYQTGMSMADFLFTTAISGGNSALSLGIMGTGAAADTVIYAKDRGLSDNQAFALGTIAGAAEIVTEKISLDALLDATQLGKNALGYIAKNMIAEGSEEVTSSAINLIADVLISKDKSEWRTAIDAYKTVGMDDKEAFWHAVGDQALSFGLDFLGGAASGGVMGGGGVALNAVKTAYQGSEFKGFGADLTREALEINPENLYAQKMQGKIDKGKALSNYQLGKLYQQNEMELYSQDKGKIKSAVEAILTELGETKNISKLADIVTKYAAGEELTYSEKSALKKNQNAQQVLSDLDSGNKDSGWTGNIGTNRINAEAYGRNIPAEAEATAQGVISAPANPVNQTATPTAKNDIPESTKMVSDGEHFVAVDNTSADTASNLEKASAKYGAQAGAFMHIYNEGQDVEKYGRAYSMAYDMGKSGVSISYAMKSGATAYLTDTQRQLAYEAGREAADRIAKARDEKNKAAANGKTGRRQGTVRGDGVTIADLKKAFNDSQNQAYKILCSIAEATGIDIVLYRSEANVNGDFEDAQGKYNKKEEPGKLYIDINSGLRTVKDIYNGDTDSVDKLAKYTMLRTFSHEFTHFIENWNPIWYNDFRKTVFTELEARGEDVSGLIEKKQAQNPGMSYDRASREVIAEAMTDILPDSHFIETLATKHKTVFEKLREKLKEFIADLKAYFKQIADNPSREANALKVQLDGALHYMESIVKMFDEGALAAVENYQKTVAVDEAVSETAETVSDSGANVQDSAKDEDNSTQTAENEAVNETPTETETADSSDKTENKETSIEDNEHFSITENAEYGSLEIKFDGKPSAEIREMLKKEYHFRWLGKKGVWYGKADHAEISKSLQAVYKAYEIGVKEAKEQKSIVPASKSNDMYALENEVKKHLLPIIDAYNSGVADEINRQTLNEVKEESTQAETKEAAEEKPSDFETAFWNAPQEQRDEVVDAINANNKLTHMRTDYREGMPFNTSETTPTENETVNDGEEKNNVENADIERPILEPDTDGQRTSRLLDEPQTEDVRGASSERDTLGDSRQREHETSRNGDRTDADTRNSRSEGSGESRDLRRDELTAEDVATDTNVGDTDAEQLQAVVKEQIEQKSTELPKGNNFVIGDSLRLPDGEKARFRANIDAIRLIKQLEAERRFATAAEQEVLSKYVGWGGLSGAFGELVWNRETRKQEMIPKNGWREEFSELKSLVSDGIITEQEYKEMSASTKNAHYTSIEVIKAMYDGLKQLGFNGGRMLEPSSGVGNFVGAMPAEMSAKVRSWTMVELDRITGSIAKYLYPNADVRIQGFENANIPDNYMDVAIGNVPFGDFGVIDRAYPKRITKSIHNYFFAKSIDKVRPGGIVMFITSSFTMNSQDTAVRQFIMDRADLLGAIRLPNTAFKGNAGTDVVTDILILKKRENGTEYTGEDFVGAEYSNEYDTYINGYFQNHPEMVLGKPVKKRGSYGYTLTYDPFTDKGSIDEQIREAFRSIKGKMDYPAKRSPEKTNFAVERAAKKTKAGGFVVNSDGSISKNENGQLVKVDTDEKTAQRISGMLGIRDAYRKLANHLQQGLPRSEIKSARTALNAAYDKFTAEYGPLNTPANKKAISSDPDSYSLLSLENYDPKKKTATKADIFTKDTISPNKTVKHANNIEEGVIASINFTGGVDASFIAKLMDKSEEDVTREIIDSRLAFKTRDNRLIARETYLSGNVRAKLREAESLAPYDKDFNHNIEELRKVIPPDIPYNEIYITPGATFVPNEIYADFIAHMLGGRNNRGSYGGPDVEVGRTASGEFKIVLNNKRLKSNHYNTQTWGTARKSFLELIDAMMGSRSVKVNDTVENGEGKKISVVNEAETEAANEKVKAIQKEFEDWLWKDENRRKTLAKLYNETFNAIVNPKYDGSHLSVNGVNPEYSLRGHQANAVHRIIASGGNTLLAHKVGAGKTLEMAAAAMKMRELGVIQKPLFVVPKSVVAQWGVEFHNYFPAARLLVADDKSFTPDNRKIFTNRIANGDYDAVIVSYEQFEKIPMSAEYQSQFYEEQIDEIIAAIAEEKAESRDGKGLTVKEMEKKKSQLEKKLKELTQKPKDEDNAPFEMLGIDSLFVDEAHNFKNLEYVSKMSNVAGLGSTKGSQRAFDLYTKVRYLQGLNGGRGIVFATATPVMNSMVELYIMQRYLQPDLLNQLGLKSFDSWAKQFGEVVNKWEINPSGTGMRQKQVFANFKNLNELQLLFRSFADVLTEVPGLKIPKMKGGSVKIVECEPGEFQKNYMKELQHRAENVKNVDPAEDNMLKITSDGRKVSYTQRMIDPTLPYEPSCKIFMAADNVLKEYRDSDAIKGTQIVFMDMATPKGTDKSRTQSSDEDISDDGYDEESARLYEDMRDYLVKKGIPKSEIAFIHEANSDAKRKRLFEDVNNGKVRVLMGSTGKMGVGMNAQKRVVAIHHLDAPWRPGDVEQRDGRAFRQKNMNEEVSKYVYVTKGSFDSRLWDILDRKQYFISQIMNGEDVGRTAEDTGEVTLSAAEVKALASGNPLIEEQTKLTDQIKKLENLQKAYNASIRLAKTKLADDEARISGFRSRIDGIREDIATRVDTYSDGKFSMTVGKQIFSDKKEAGAALALEIAAKANINSLVTVADFAGFEIKAIKNGAEYQGFIHGKESYRFNVYMNNTTRMVNHLCDMIAGFETMINNLEQAITEVSADRDAQYKILSQPFERQTELEEKRARFNEIMELLSPKNEQQFGADDDDVQEQSREYLEDEDVQYQQSIDTFSNRRFSYDELTAKGDIIGITIKNSTEVPLKDDGSIDAMKIVEAVRDRCRKLTLSGATSTYFVYATDIGRNVQIASKGITHGFFDSTRKNKRPSSRDLINAKVSLAIPEILSNSIEVNRSYRDGNNNISYAHIMIGTVGIENDVGIIEYYAVRSVIEERNNLNPILVEAEILGKLHAVNAKKIDSSNHEITDKNVTRRHGDVYFDYSIAHLLEDVKGVFTDTFSEDVYERFGDERTDTEFSKNLQYQQRISPLTDREVLEIAANEIDMSKLTPAERDALDIFQDRLNKLKVLQDKKAPRSQIQKVTENLLSVEEKAILQRVLVKARKVVEDLQWEHDQEILRRWRDRRDNAAAIKKYRDRIRTDTEDLKNWIIKPDNKNIAKHIPDVLKESVIPFLESINFMSKQALNGGNPTKADQLFLKKLDKLHSAMKSNIDANGLYSGYNDLPQDFMTRLEDFIKSAKAIIGQNTGDIVINRMTSDELKSFSQIVRNLKALIINLNRFHNNAMFAHVSDAGKNSIAFLETMKGASGVGGGISNFLFWQQMRPDFAWERFGEGGRSIGDELKQGQATLAFNTKEIISFAEKTYTEKEVRSWEDQIKTFTIGNDTVKIPVSHIMALYELSKDPDGKRHILSGGIRVDVYERKGKTVADNGHTLTTQELDQIIGSLTDRQKDVADALQRYMADQGGKWGNYVSVARFGEEQFTNKTYFPISSDGRYLPAKAEKDKEGSSLYALLNMSFTKSRDDKAKNRIMIYSIFDVFANHMADMAQYNAMALPILDAIKWLNYQESFVDNNGNKVITANLRQQMDRVYGISAGSAVGYAQNFVINIIKAFNGTAAQGTPYDTKLLKALRRYNMAQVGYNFRVVLQQPMAITRAGMLIDYKSILKGLKLNPSAIKKNIEEMQKHSGIAAWKSLGFYDVNISRGLTHLIKHDDTFFDKVSNVGMWGAEKADTLTWSAIWSACKVEVTKKKKLKPSDKGFYEAVTKLFDDVVYKTQVVDSILTKNEFMRDKGAFARILGSFMSEATTNASMLLDTYDKYNLDIKNGISRQQAWQKHGKRFGRTVYVYSIGAILLAAVQSLSDAWRDDDEYEEFSEKYWDAFKGNLIDELMPFNKLPIIDQGWEFLKAIDNAGGFTNLDLYGQLANLPFTDIADQLLKSVQIFSDKIMDENTNYTWYGGAYKLLQAASGLSGLPIAAATREIVTAWNTTVGAMAPSLKVITYEATETETRTALYEAVISGDDKERFRIENEKYGGDLKEIKSALRKALRENDPRIREAAEAAADGKTALRNKLYAEIVDEGNFPKDIISSAIAAEIESVKALRKKEKEGK